jgi:alpha-galactosidase
MVKVTFMGAGSTVFAKNVLGDCLISPELKGMEIALYDIDNERLQDSLLMLKAINRQYKSKATIKTYLGVRNRKKALAGADFVVNAIQVGGYDPCTITDFEIPKKYGLRQTIADTLGVGGIFRALRTIPVIQDFLADMEQVCPNALFINYSNPMAIITGTIQKTSPIKSLGLCHSVQHCAERLMHNVGLDAEYDEKVQWNIAGINHQAWLLSISKNGEDLYPRIKKLADEIELPKEDLVRMKLMKTFGYYVTESSEHSSEYLPYFIKTTHPELIEEYNIPLDEYPRRCINQIEDWKKRREELTTKNKLEHTNSGEYAAHIIEAMLNNKPYKLGGNVVNKGYITNLPKAACVEVPCIIDASGVQPLFVGDLPEQLAALNRTNVNPQILAMEAAMTLKKEYVYEAALLDPHTAAELTIDQIISMCDDLFEAHKDWMPAYH